MGLTTISSDNASNFTSYEFVNWADRYDIHLDYSAAWNPAGNMHAERYPNNPNLPITPIDGPIVSYYPKQLFY